ncbi:hypothetical protein BFW38_16745 [Terasakiispira papahanaumokuakeensis]|uniref:Uncharacterized protein n=1 Tax=Terasakiispira papahanaumokuakeensis TaxID=197479 RepID=A0A1E2VDN8_9GAMM|nr:hypothetical protein [Terasakiispira papahanaumokuakeensis]ODC04936.1 hypothetical protein BFW38_16745 [Terasakiispira papahanaumokuakeensis]
MSDMQMLDNVKAEILDIFMDITLHEREQTQRHQAQRSLSARRHIERRKEMKALEAAIEDGWDGH